MIPGIGSSRCVPEARGFSLTRNPLEIAEEDLKQDLVRDSTNILASRTDGDNFATSS